MKIKSNFKDYYDYIANQYGGGDPKIVYLRHRLGTVEDIGGTTIVRGITVRSDAKLPGYQLPRLIHDKSNYHTNSWKDLVVCGRVFPILPDAVGSNKYVVFDPAKHSHLILPGRNQEKYMEYSPYWQDHAQSKGAISLHRELKTPVFVVNHEFRYQKYTEYHISGEYTILNDMMLAPYFPADQIYQELSYFIGNIMNDSPDMMPLPKPPMTDKERILSHGFDLKQSFRHRK